MKKLFSFIIVAAVLLCLTIPAVTANDAVPTLAVGTATAGPGETVKLAVSVKDATYAVYGLTVKYDTAALKLTDINSDSQTGFFTANAATGIVTDFSAKDMTVSGDIFFLTFEVLENATAGMHEVTVEVDSFNTADKETVEVDVVSGGVTVITHTLTVSSKEAKVGEEVTVDVTVSGIYAAYGLTVDYDKEALELVSVNQNADNALDFFETKDGKITDIGDVNHTVNGTIFTLTFKALKAGEHKVSVEVDSFVMADKSEVTMTVTPGTVTVTEAGGEEPTIMYGDVNGDGKINGKDYGLLAQFLAEWDVDINEKNSDVNADGKINGKDYGLLAQYLAEWDVTLGG